jgi:class 3 adenylate cyclase
VIGEAVNFASRIQTAGIAGSVLISEKVKMS